MNVAAFRVPFGLRRLVSLPHRGVAEAATLISLYALYEVIRGGGHATFAVAKQHTDAIVALERHLHLYAERAVQDVAHAVPGLPALLGFAYIALHFVGTTAFLVWIYRRHADRFAFVRNTFVVASAIALVIYILYPAAPPRLAGLGFADTVTDSARMNLSSEVLGAVYNPFAAVPSLHFGYALLIGITLWSLGRRTAAIAYPTLMLFVIVATGNHFFFDAAAGGIVVVAGYFVARAIRDAREPSRRPHAESAVAQY